MPEDTPRGEPFICPRCLGENRLVFCEWCGAETPIYNAWHLCNACADERGRAMDTAVKAARMKRQVEAAEAAP